MTDETKQTLTKQANSSFKDGEVVDSTVPATTGSTAVAKPALAAGGLSYATAHADEKAKMDEIIAGIDLTKPDTVVSLGSQERQELATLADKILDSIDPTAKIAFAEAFKGLIDAVKSNSLGEIKKRLGFGSKGILSAFTNVFKSDEKKKAERLETSKKMLTDFMKDINSSRKIIQEETDRLTEQKDRLEKNYVHIKELGLAISQSAQRLRVVRAATAEYIRRVESGENKVLTELEATAQTTGRADDVEKLQVAQASWNNLRTGDGDLLGSISTFDRQVAQEAYNLQANLKNRMDTMSALSSTVSEWKTNLAVYASTLEEQTAALTLDDVRTLNMKAADAGEAQFEQLVDAMTARAGKGNYDLVQQKGLQDKMLAKLEQSAPIVAAAFEQEAKQKAALAESSEAFKKGIVGVFSKKGGVLGTSAPKAPGM